MAASGAVWVKMQGGKYAGQMVVLPKAVVSGALAQAYAGKIGLGGDMLSQEAKDGLVQSYLQHYKAGPDAGQHYDKHYVYPVAKEVLESFVDSQSPKAIKEAVAQEQQDAAAQLLKAMGYVEGGAPAPKAAPAPAQPIAEQPVTPKKAVSQAVETTPVSEAAVTDAFPDSTTYVKTLGGSTGAQLVKGPDGQLYVKKTGNSPEHIEAEYLADKTLQALGLDVPAATMKSENGAPYKLARFVPDAQTLGSLKGAARSAAEENLRKGFIGDVLVGDWDVIGMGADNVLVGKGGQTWRIDNGGSFAFRAQGGKKEYGTIPMELLTMTDPKYDAGKVYGKMAWSDIALQINHLAPKFPAAAKAAGKYSATVQARGENLVGAAKLIDALVAQGESEHNVRLGVHQALFYRQMGDSWAQILGQLLG